MAIASAVQKGSTVHVYNEKGTTMFTKSGTLIGFTSTTVSVKNGSSVHTYGENGTTLFSKSAS